MKTRTAGLIGLLLMGFSAVAQEAQVKATMIIYLDPERAILQPGGAGRAGCGGGLRRRSRRAICQQRSGPPERPDRKRHGGGVDGIAVAISRGIIVIGFNNDDLDGAKGNCRQAYVGMDEEASAWPEDDRGLRPQGGRCRLLPARDPGGDLGAVARGGGIERAMGRAWHQGRDGARRARPRRGAEHHDAIPHRQSAGQGGLRHGFGDLDRLAAASATRGWTCLSRASTLRSRSPMRCYRGRCSPRWTSSSHQPIAQIALAKRYGLTPTDVDTGQGAFLDKTRFDDIKPLIGTYR